MAKEISGLIKLQIRGGAANPSPPVGPALGAKGVNIMDLTKKRNGEEYDTIGGLVFNVTNRIPSRGEVVTDSLGNEFSVLEADPRSIKRLRLNLRS